MTTYSNQFVQWWGRKGLRAIAISTLSAGALCGFSRGEEDMAFYDASVLEGALVDALENESLEHEGDASPTLPLAMAASSDLVDLENVSETGESVYVAVLDTGLIPRWPYFFPKAKIAWDLGIGFTHDLSWDESIQGLRVGPLRSDRGFITNRGSGHGTHVASTVVGYRWGPEWVEGVAPHATIIPVLVLDGWNVPTPNGPIRFEAGSEEMIAAGVDYVTHLADSLSGRIVINMSLGGAIPSPLIEGAIDRAIAKGVIVVAAGGNEGTKGMQYPGGKKEVISAGAVGWSAMNLAGGFKAAAFSDPPERLVGRDELGNSSHLFLANFSSRPNRELDQKHQHLDVSAPGVQVYGPYRPPFRPNWNGGIWWLSGTSMATPHVAGIAALLLERHPDLQQAEVEAILKRAAASLPLPASDATVVAANGNLYYPSWDGGDYGAGFLQADTALFLSNFIR